MFTAAGLGLHDPEGGGTDDKGALENPIQMLIDDCDVLLGPVHATGQALCALIGREAATNWPA